VKPSGPLAIDAQAQADLAAARRLQAGQRELVTCVQLVRTQRELRQERAASATFYLERGLWILVAVLLYAAGRVGL